MARMVALRDLDNVVVSGSTIDDEIVQAQGKLDESHVVTELPMLSNNWLEEADCRTIIHVNWYFFYAFLSRDDNNPRRVN